MTTKTGMSDHWKLKYLNRLNGLAFSAYDLVCRDTRSEHEIETLLDAMQEFKLGKLRGVIRPIADDSTREEMFKAFSMTVVETGLGQSCKKYLHRRGVCYVGEIYYVFFDPKSPQSVEMGRDIFKSLGDLYGLPKRADPLSEGWEPPYWKQESFLASLRLPVIQVLGDYGKIDPQGFGTSFGVRRNPAQWTWARKLHSRGIHYFGQYLAEERGQKRPKGSNAWGAGALEDKQRTLMAVGASLWAAALIPKDWEAPREIPASWLEEQKRIEQEIAERQVRKERERRKHEPSSQTKDEEMPELNIFRSVAELELSVRASNALKSLGILYVGQLVMHTETELLRQKSDGQYLIGHKTLMEIKTVLSSMGLSLGMLLLPDIQAKLGVLVAGNDGDQTSAP